MVLAAHRYVTVDGRRTHLLHGTGEPRILLLHGAGGSAWTFSAVLDAWEPPGWACPDLLGYGESSWLAAGEYSSTRQADQLSGVLDQIGVNRVHVVGFSWGGLIGLQLASQDSRVDRLAVIDIAPSSAQPATAVPAIAEVYPTMTEAIDIVRGLAPRADPAVILRDAELSTAPCPEGFRKKIDPGLLRRWPFHEEDHWENWRLNGRQTLLIRAEHSPVLSPDGADQMLAQNGKASFSQIAGSGHLIPLEQPAALAATLAGFLR